MDKKNTMLLTVIAVATLLVAVVGATFAYFAVSQTSKTVTTGVTGTVSSNTRTIALTGTDKSLSLNVTGNQMDESHKGTPYYAVVSGDPDTEPKNHDIGAITVGGTTSDTYTCTFDVTVKQGSDHTMTNLPANEAVVKLTGTGVTLSSTDDIDVSTLTTTGTKLTATVDVTPAMNAETALKVTGDVIFNNTNAVQTASNYTGNIKVDIVANNLVCTLKAS